MSTYSKALRHIDMKDVKKKHQQKIIEQKIQKKLEKEEKKYIQSVMETVKYDWRKEIQSAENQVEEIVDDLIDKEYDWREQLGKDKKKYFEEGMTSAGTFFTTLPAAGDTNLETLAYSEYQVNYSDSINLGNDFGSEYLQFTGLPQSGSINDNRYVIMNPVDTTNYTTISLSVIKGNNTGYLQSPTRDLQVYWYRPGAGSGYLGQILKTSVSSISPSSIIFNLPTDARGPGLELLIIEPYPASITEVGGQQFVGQSIPSIHPITFNASIGAWVASLLYYYPNITEQQKSDYGFFIWNSMQDAYVGNWPGTPGYPSPIDGYTQSISGPEQIYISNAIIQQFASSYRKYGTTYAITGVGLQRRTPLNVFVPLDNPAASAFIRTEPNLYSLSPQERQQKLKEMLEASDEYVTKILGTDFPGTGAVPPGESSGTSGVQTTDYENDLTPLSDKPYGTEVGQVGGIYDLIKSGQVPYMKPDKAKQILSDPKFQKLWDDDPDMLKQVQKLLQAHYKPEGQLISERKKLKSPEEVLNKIPGYYDGKPAPLGFPVEQPPKMVNGMHPDLVNGKNVANRFNRLDPESAKATPLTGNPHIDKKIKAARKQPK